MGFPLAGSLVSLERPPVPQTRLATNQAGRQAMGYGGTHSPGGSEGYEGENSVLPQIWEN